MSMSRLATEVQEQECHPATPQTSLLSPSTPLGFNQMEAGGQTPELIDVKPISQSRTISLHLQHQVYLELEEEQASSVSCSKAIQTCAFPESFSRSRQGCFGDDTQQGHCHARHSSACHHCLQPNSLLSCALSF